MIGLLGLFAWKVTVISSNFIALMLILTMSMNIHYLVRYMQNQIEYDENTAKSLVTNTSGVMFFQFFMQY